MSSLLPSPASFALVAGLAAPAAALATAALVVALRPLLVRYALARPSARGLHVTPTPQGGGLAILGALVPVVIAGALALGLPAEAWRAGAMVVGAALGLAVVGVVDDVRPLPPLPRLVAQVALAGLAVAALPVEARVLPDVVPSWLETGLLVVGLAWFVNATNFMDGMDGITVADMVPVAGMLAVFALDRRLDTATGLIAAALTGGLLGFLPFNRPPARLFLGDVGSLPIGLLVGAGLVALAAAGHLAAALLLPLYPLADTGVTLARRLARGERVWTPHRQHFYQQAVLAGVPVLAVLAGVVSTNLLLAALAAVSVLADTALMSLACLMAGIALVGLRLAMLGGLGCFRRRAP